MGFETDVKNIMKSCMKKWEMFILSWGFRCKQGFAFKLLNSLKVYHEISEKFSPNLWDIHDVARRLNLVTLHKLI